jgi:iron complex transport system substrate-binding protein
MPRTRPRALVAALTGATLALVLAGCGAGDDAAPASTSPSPSASSDFPVTVDSPTGELTIEARPERIVSLSPSATESLFAIGAGDQVVAVDEYSTYPAEAPVTDLSGYEPNVEAIASYQPDLVVASNDAGDMVAGLGKLGVPVLLSPAPTTVDGGYDTIAALGLATGHVDETAQVVDTMRQQVADALAKAPQTPVRVYHEIDDTYYAASSYGFIGSVYEAMGAENIADAADADKSGYPQLTEEAIIAADPQVIVITDQVGYTAEDVAKRPGWQDVSAVRGDHVVTVDADIASRWGPRLPQLISTLADAMAAAAVPSG